MVVFRLAHYGALGIRNLAFSLFLRMPKDYLRYRQGLCCHYWFYRTRWPVVAMPPPAQALENAPFTFFALPKCLPLRLASLAQNALHLLGLGVNSE
jgi:hypothetical protein